MTRLISDLNFLEIGLGLLVFLALSSNLYIATMLILSHFSIFLALRFTSFFC